MADEQKLPLLYERLFQLIKYKNIYPGDEIKTKQLFREVILNYRLKRDDMPQVIAELERLEAAKRNGNKIKFLSHDEK